MQYRLEERAEKSLTQIFDSVAKKYPEKIAVKAGTNQISYGELDRRSNQVAHMLHEKGVGEDDIVAIFVDKSIHTITCILGILKAGAAYLPVDILLPNSRIKYMLGNGNARFIMNTELAGHEIQQLLAECAIPVVSNHEWNGCSEDDVDWRRGTNTLAYVMYTSGSEGKPKGVMIEDRGIIRLVADEEYFPFCSDWNILQSSTLVFDASVFEVYGALLNGATLHLMDTETLLNGESLKEWLAKQPIDVMFLTTPLFHQLVHVDVSIFDSVHNLVVGGDVLLAKQAGKLKEYNPKIRLFNGYGPTENTTFSTFYEVPAEVSENVPIGKPISSSTAYIWDAQNKPVKNGETGELYVGGEGVGRGYINDEKLTEQKFLTHPDTGERLYRTGDLARWKKDGNIEFVGRADTQIKMRGFRIELQEIQKAVNGLHAVRECVVLCETCEEEKTLTAYLVLQEEIEREALQEQLQRILPSYMIPNEIIIVKYLPLNLNGKIDKHQLAQIKQQQKMQMQQQEVLQEPKTEENKVTAILKEQLKQSVSLENNLYEIGFNSITAVKVLSAFRKQGYAVGIKEILSVRTVRDMVNMVLQKRSAE